VTVGPWIGRRLGTAVLGSGRRPLLTVLVSGALAALALFYTFHTLTFLTSAVRLLPQHERYVAVLREHMRDFRELNDIVVAVEASSPDVSTAYANRIVQELRQGGLTSRITYRLDLEYFKQRGLLYLSVDELTRLRDRMFDYQEFIETYAARPTLAQLLDGLNQQIANAFALGFLDLGLGAERKTDLRFLRAVLDEMSARLDGRSAFTSPWTTAFTGGHLDDPNAGYFFSSDRKLLFLFLEQRQEEGDFVSNRARIEAVRNTIARLGPEFPGVEAGVTGSPAISNDEMVSAFADSRIATLLAIAMTLALLIASFRRVGMPLLMLVTLLVSLAWSMGVITLVIGHLSIFSVMFISIVLGIGIDYGIYFLFRYAEERSLGATVTDGLFRTAERTGPGMLLGALTAAGAFFVLMLTDFQGVRELGFVAGTAILLAFLAMLTLFPALLVLRERRPHRRPAVHAPLSDHAELQARWLVRITEHRRTILVASAGITVLALWGTAYVDFNYNMLELQARGVQSVLWEQRILARAGRSGFAALATASSLDELRQKHAAFGALPSVSTVESILMLLPDRQHQRIKLIEQFAPLVESVRVATPPPLEPASLHAPLETLRRRLGIAAREAGPGKARNEVQAALTQVDGLVQKLARINPGAIAPALDALQSEMARDFGNRLRALQQSLPPRPIGLQDLPVELRQRYVGKSGRLLLRIHPAVDIWQQASAERFVRELRGVDADVTGPPVTSFEAIRIIRRGYLEGTLYALVLVAVITAAILRSARGTALALTPLILGVLWTVGLMRVFDLQFNLANVWALPLIIGTAAEYGLNIFVRFLEGRDGGGPTLSRGVVRAVVLNGLTTIAGFGSLLVAHHRGIFSLGLLLTVGAIASLVSSLAVLPVLIHVFGGPLRRARPR